MGNILYQGPYTPQQDSYYANYTVTVPESFTPGKASLNAINLFMVGVRVFALCASGRELMVYRRWVQAEYEPIVNYLNENVTVVASN